jgi:hypothetical protein
MASFGPLCDTREGLKARMRADLEALKDALYALEAHPRLNFHSANKKAEDARHVYDAARETLERHLATHGCREK